jgi:uncharacterized protein YacL
VRGATCVVGALGGAGVARALLARGVLTEPINLVYLTLLGLLCGYLVSPPLVRAAYWLQGRAARVPPDAVLAAGVGTAFALFVTVLLNSALERVPGFSWVLSLLVTLLLVVASSWFAVVNRKLLPPATLHHPPTGADPSAHAAATVLDTSALIDGRVVEIAEAGFLSGKLLVPRFVLLELQGIADANDAERRKRGRRGLEVLEALRDLPDLTLHVVPDAPPGTADEAVDAKLVSFCRTHRTALVTTDANLGYVARLEGVRVLNPHALARALRSHLSAGDQLAVRVVKPGREAGQGLGYLDDGTLIVVEGGGEHIGQEVAVVVTGQLQTHLGRMVFAKLEPSPARPPL